MKIEMNNKELYEVIKKAVNGDMKAKFEIILIFQELIEKESYINGKYSEECKDYIEDRILKDIEYFKYFKKL